MDAIDEQRGGKRTHEAAQEGFIEARDTFKRRAKVDKGPEPIPVSNSFEALEAVTEEIEEAEQETVPETNEEHSEPPRPAEVRPPPPIIINPPISQISIKRMLTRIGVTQFCTNNSSKETRLYLKTEQDHSKVFQLMMMDKDVQFHTFAPRGTRRSNKFVLHGFDVDYEIDELIADLQLRLPGFKMARRLKKTEESGRTYDTEAIQIITEHFVKIEDIIKLGAIDNVLFRVRPYNEKYAPVQCRNCQNYGHTMKYCGRTCHCAWCGDHHLYNQCPKTNMAKCSNCTGEHPAFFRECPHRVKIEQEKKEKRQKATTAANKKINKNTREGITYSNAIGGATSQSEKRSPPHHHTPEQPTRSTEPSANPGPDTSTNQRHESSTNQSTESSTLAAFQVMMNQMFARIDQMMQMVTTVLQVVLDNQQRHG